MLMKYDYLDNPITIYLLTTTNIFILPAYHLLSNSSPRREQQTRVRCYDIQLLFSNNRWRLVSLFVKKL